MTNKRYALAEHTDNEGVTAVYTTDPPLTWEDAIEAQEWLRDMVPLGHSVILIPHKTLPVRVEP